MRCLLLAAVTAAVPLLGSRTAHSSNKSSLRKSCSANVSMVGWRTSSTCSSCRAALPVLQRCQPLCSF
jgi:hypothetical protein